MTNGMTDFEKHQRGLDVRAAITKATGLRKVGGRWMGERGPSVTRKSPKFKLTLEEKLARSRAQKAWDTKPAKKKRISDARTRVGGGSPGSRVAGGLARFRGR